LWLPVFGSSVFGLRAWVSGKRHPEKAKGAGSGACAFVFYSYI
jgi:hypothetical protein